MEGLQNIRKRDGQIVPFDQEKVTNAIFKAAKAAGGGDLELAKKISRQVVTVLEVLYKDERVPTVENVQDLVEKILIENGHAKTAKSYILYREQRSKSRAAKSTMMHIEETMDGYLKQHDWRVKENSNSKYSLSGLLMHAAGAVVANYTLQNIYPKEIRDAHINADLHIHDLSLGIAGYCAGWSIRQLLEEGFNGVSGENDSGPAKHLTTALGQMVNFLGTMQNEWAGAQAFSSFDTYLAPFVRHDNLSYKEVKQLIQQFVFNINVASRWGGQKPFVNITLDWTVPEDMKGLPVLVGGQRLDSVYGDYQQEMDMINKAFIEVMTAGDSKGRIFTFPIPTYNITKDFNWDSENANLLFEMTAKYGTPYFQNFINSELSPGDVRSMCCRLQMDMRELKSRGGGLFGAVEMTGSVGVVTLNMARIGYLAKDKQDFLKRSAELMELAKQSLEIKREVVQKNIDDGLMPYTKRYLKTLTNHFSTIGLNGMNEALLNFMDTDIASKEGRSFTLEVLDFMRDKLADFQEETGHIYNLEATPAEGTTYRLAKKDKELYPDIIVANLEEESNPYYTNSTQLPVGHTADIFEALDLQDELQTKYTGGTVLHGFIGEKISDVETCKKLVKSIAYNYRLPYYTITPTFSICPQHGYIAGEHHTCPKETTHGTCAKDCEVFSRIVGYHRPVKHWNKGKQSEFVDRLAFEEKQSVSSSNKLSKKPRIARKKKKDQKVPVRV